MICHKDTGDLQKGSGSLEGGAGAGKEQWGKGAGVVPSLQPGLRQPPRSERAEASVLGSRPTYLLHCLFWPPSWSTEKKPRRGWVWSSYRAGVTVQVLHSEVRVSRSLVGDGPGDWPLPRPKQECREWGNPDPCPVQSHDRACWSWDFLGQLPQRRGREIYSTIFSDVTGDTHTLLEISANPSPSAHGCGSPPASKATLMVIVSNATAGTIMC